MVERKWGGVVVLLERRVEREGREGGYLMLHPEKNFRLFFSDFQETGDLHRRVRPEVAHKLARHVFYCC